MGRKPSRARPKPRHGHHAEDSDGDEGGHRRIRSRLADWSEDYFDGLGRTYKSLKRGPSATQAIVVEKLAG
jgi:hypothetical protein